jgi:hypothetical protein
MSVNVLQLGGEPEVTPLNLVLDGIETADNGLSLIGREQADLPQHPGVSLAGLNVLPVETPVDADRFSEGFDLLIGIACETSAPAFLLAHNRGLEIEERKDML